MKSILPKLAAWGEVALVTDHKHIFKKQGDKESKCLGISAVVSDRYGYQTPVILDYIPCESSASELTVPLLKQVLTNFDLDKPFKKGKISISCDGAMVKTARDLFRSYQNDDDDEMNGVYTFCNVHNLNCIVKRLVFSLLDEYLTGGTAMYKEIQTKITACSNALGSEFNNMEVSPAIKNKVLWLFYYNFEKISKTVFYKDGFLT